MTKEDKQIIDRAVKEGWGIGDRTRLKRLLEKNLKQYRDKVELENKIADIKANCDLAIEGRDIKIKELEKENAELKRQRNNCEEQFQNKVEEVGIEIEKRLLAEERCKKLEQQIEKMKRCEICKHFRWNCCSCEIRISKDCLENGMKHFELKEIEK